MSYKLTLNILCNDAANTTDWIDNGIVDSTDPCSPVITVTHAKACPVFSASTFAKSFTRNTAILAPLAIIFGLIVTIYGRKFFPITIFATGSLAGFAITLLLFTMLSMFESAREKNQRIELTVLGSLFSYVVSLFVGIFVGFILQRMLKIGAAIIGAIGGFFISIPLSNLLLGWADSDILLQSVSVLSALILAVLSLKYYDTIVIFGTAVLGSYLFVRGFSLFIEGSFPPESQIFEKIASGEVQSIFYVYLAVFSIMVGLGTFY